MRAARLIYAEPSQVCSSRAISLKLNDSRCVVRKVDKAGERRSDRLLDDSGVVEGINRVLSNMLSETIIYPNCVPIFLLMLPLVLLLVMLVLVLSLSLFF